MDSIGKNVVIFLELHTLITSVVQGSTSPRRFPDRILCGRRLIFRRHRMHPIRCWQSRVVSSCHRRRVRRSPPFLRNTRCNPFLHKQTSLQTTLFSRNIGLCVLSTVVRRYSLRNAQQMWSSCSCEPISVVRKQRISIAGELIKAKAIVIILLLILRDDGLITYSHIVFIMQNIYTRYKWLDYTYSCGSVKTIIKTWKSPKRKTICL